MRPVIPVVLSHRDKSKEHEVLIDSGSDKCFFDAEVAEQLGISIKDIIVGEAFGIKGNKSLYYSHPITITVGNVSYTVNAGFMPSVMGGIVPYGFVGQKGFFDKFIIKFDLPKREVVLLEAKN